MEELVGRRLLAGRRVDGVALEQACAACAGVLDRGLGEGGADSALAVRARHDEARDRPDGGVVEIGVGRAAGDDPAVLQAHEVGSGLDRAPADRGLAVVGDEARPGAARVHLSLESITEGLVADAAPVAAGDLVPLAPAVRGIALGAEHRLDIGEGRVLRGDDAQGARLGVVGRRGVHALTLARAGDIRSVGRQGVIS